MRCMLICLLFVSITTLELCIMKLAAFTLVCFVVLVLELTVLWQHNLPNWCANPDVGGNHVVQPFCGE